MTASATIETAAQHVRALLRHRAKQLNVTDSEWSVNAGAAYVMVTTDDRRLLSELQSGPSGRLRDMCGVRVVHTPMDFQAAVDRDLLRSGFAGDAARRFMYGD